MLIIRFVIDRDYLYKHFTVFDWEIYYAIFTWILVISVVSALSRRSLKTFIKTFWIYLSQILSDFSLPHKNKTLMDTILSGIWLLSCTVLLAAFSGHLRNRQLTPKPVVWIDSWQDLYERKDITIETSEIMSIVFYMDNFNDTEDMASDFRQRTKIIKEKEYYHGHKSFRDDLDYKGLVEGRVAFILDMDLLQVYKDVLVEKYKLQEDRDFHISEHGDITQPSFTTINMLKIDQQLANTWNKVIDILREGGIMNFHHDRNIKTTVDLLNYDHAYEPIIMEHIIGAFDIGGIVFVASLLILFTEFLIFYKIHYVFIKSIFCLNRELIKQSKSFIYLVKLNIYLIIWKLNKLVYNWF